MKSLQEALDAGAPYLGAELCANQGDNHFRHFPVIISAAMAGRIGVPRILEIGSWAGGSLIAWWQASQGQALLTAIDSWAPYLPPGSRWPHYAEMSHAARSGGIEALFRHNIAAAGIPDVRLTVRKGDSREILPQLPRDSFDVLFIDGDHRYSVVRADIEAALDLVRVGGFLCGDDLDQQLGDIDQAEHREIMHIDEEVATTRSGLCYHHGVVQAVHDYFGRVLCLEKRLWVVRKTADGWDSNPAI